jgi:hypothetical protein
VCNMLLLQYTQASVVDRETEDCFLLNQDTRLFPERMLLHLYFFLSSTLPAQSASVYVVRVKYSPLEYHKPKSKVPFRYLNILFTACT